MYSRRFGPIPPCFSRASIAVIAGTPMMLVAGTASIRGEESVHVNDLGGQLRETFLNLGILVRGVSMPKGAPAPSPINFDELIPFIARLVEVRIYHPRPLDERIISAAATSTF